MLGESETGSSTTNWDLLQWQIFRTNYPFIDKETPDPFVGPERMQHICALKAHSSFSPEELRLQHKFLGQ
jgi:hypothetical protein